MPARFGVTTVRRWLTEGVPSAVSPYVEYRGAYYRLKSVSGSNGTLSATLYTHHNPTLTFTTSMGEAFRLDSPIILSLGERLEDCKPENVLPHLELARPGCMGLVGDVTADEVSAVMRLLPGMTTKQIDELLYCGGCIN